VTGTYKNFDTVGEFVAKNKKGDVFTGDDFEAIKTKGKGAIGKIQFPNGDVYVGSVSILKPHGVGKMTRANGEVQEGNWEMGVFKGSGPSGGSGSNGSGKNGGEDNSGSNGTIQRFSAWNSSGYFNHPRFFQVSPVCIKPMGLSGFMTRKTPALLFTPFKILRKLI